jgi:anhydro-N-acetylmuramic acid kinase
MSSSSLLFGVMSGTSIDGIDIVLIDKINKKIKVLDFLHLPYESQIKNKILALHIPSHNELEASIQTSKIHAKITASGINQILKKLDIKTNLVKAIGYHGQTIRHKPDMQYSIQIGDAHLLAELTKISVVSDFRNRDLVAGGQGAPLVPTFHQDIFSSKNKNRVILNIGGISNITFLPTQDSILGFDCGPGNILLDHWIKEHKNLNYDTAGKWARSGTLIKELLTSFLKEDFFKKIPPKSTGRDLFNLEWINHHIKKEYSLEDIQNTLVELTAISIINSINKFCPKTDEIFICGGGSQNLYLLERIKSLSTLDIKTTNNLNIPPQQVESIAFAWLADKTMQKQFNNTPSVTGAHGPRILGTVHFS